MDKWKRILAWIGIILLLLLYVCTLVSAIFVTPATQGFFKASLLATIMIPILLYGYLLVYRVKKRKKYKSQKIKVLQKHFQAKRKTTANNRTLKFSLSFLITKHFPRRYGIM